MITLYEQQIEFGRLFT